MKTDLSSQITLTRIPQRYYRPENAFEHSVLTRLEKIPTNLYESADEGSFAIAKEIADQIRKKQEIGENFVMAIPLAEMNQMYHLRTRFADDTDRTDLNG